MKLGWLDLSSNQTKGVLAALVTVTCWSGFNIVSRFGTKGVFTPFDMAAMRFGVAGALTMPFFLYLVPVRSWPKYMVLALFGGLGYGLLVYSGFAFAPSAHAGVFVNGGIPFWTVILTAVLVGVKLSRHVYIALALSTCGLVMIAFNSMLAQHAPNQWIGDLFFLAAAFCWAVFGLLVRRWQIRPHHGIFGIATFASLVYLPIYYLWLPKGVFDASMGDIALQCIYQGIIAALLAAGMFSYATHKIGACEAAMMLALVPAISAVGGYFILGEDLSIVVIVGIVIVSLGALLGAMPANTVAFLVREKT
jgi:drug/metabolite transporter (DMT)-like permease